ncbi:hypothetical protein GCM10027098_14070 [Bowmanella dokdonensis]
MFTALTLVVLAVLWAATFNFITRERETAHQTAAALAADVADTYEAQVVRALREIDQTLKLVGYELRRQPPQQVLDDLGMQGLLPPPMLFTIEITDAGGGLLVRNNDSDIPQAKADTVPESVRSAQDMVVGLPQRTGHDEWQLRFAQGYRDNQGRFAGVVSVLVPAAYFVSGYEPSVMGNSGVLGMIGTDGIFRVKRTGEAISAGDALDYSALAQEDVDANSPASVQSNPWDNTRRYTIIRKLYQYPLAIVVGLSEKEQLAGAHETVRLYILRSAGASLFLIIIFTLLGWLNWRLQQERKRVMEERIEHAKQVEYLAFHDSLTDLPNRAYFSHLLTENMQRVHRYERHLALLFLDLDRFKTINDSLGHDAGDELLREVALRLRASVRESDIVARLGGDEFVVLLPEISEAEQVVPVAEKILTAVAKPFELVGQEFRVTVSVGITLYPGDGRDEQTLMKNADVAMYHAKELGKNNFQFYSEALNTNSLERLSLESSLRSALEHNEFRLYYQPKRRMSNGEVTGMEALLRWEHPELGLVLPMQFIPLAEENGLIIPLGRWVFKTACQQNVTWQQQGYPPLTIAINLSARQFIDEHLLDDIKLALKETGMDPRLLEVEITESMVMRDLQQTIQILQSLKQMGVRVAIDDFGTGYSSLSNLKQFSVDTIKIDGSFIQDIVRSQEDQGLTEAIIAVGRSLGLTVVAEGVENSDQFEFLRRHFCDEFQGFYGNEPLTAEDFAQVVWKQANQPVPD